MTRKAWGHDEVDTPQRRLVRQLPPELTPATVHHGACHATIAAQVLHRQIFDHQGAEPSGKIIARLMQHGVALVTDTQVPHTVDCLCPYAIADAVIAASV